MFRFNDTFQHWPLPLSGVSEFRRLRQDLKHSQRSAYCAGTFSNLKTQFKAYFLFCHFFRLDHTPATRDTVCHYVQFISRTLTPASVETVQVAFTCCIYLQARITLSRKILFFPLLRLVSLVMPCTPAQGSSSYPLSMFLSVKVIRVHRLFLCLFVYVLFYGSSR